MITEYSIVSIIALYPRANLGMATPTSNIKRMTCTCQVSQLAVPLDPETYPMGEALGKFAAPSPAECDIVRKKLLQISVDILALDGEIQRMEKTIEGLRRNRVTLQKHSHSYQNLLNPIRRLPVEVLGGIFILCQGSTRRDRSILPALVCRHWRDVAIATPRLWDRLRIPYPGKRSADAEMTQIWLERSGGLPLKIDLGHFGIVVIHNDIEGPHTRKDNSAIYKSLNSHAHRWKDVKIAVIKPMFPFLSEIPEPLTMLHSLHLDGPKDKSHQLKKLSNFGNAPALRVLTLGRRVTPKLPKFPWAQLTTCTLGNGQYTSEECYHVLRQSVNLQQFKIAFSAESAFSPAQPPIRHETLLSLDIEMFGSQSQSFFNLLCLPSLTSIKFRGHPDHTSQFLPALITRSECVLKQAFLGSRGAPFLRSDLIAIFSVMTTLSELSLESGGSEGFDDLLMGMLTHEAGSRCLLPQLAMIKVWVHSGFRYEKYADFLSSRCRASMGIARLHTACLEASRSARSASGLPASYVSKDTYKRFIALRDNGLDFRVECDGGRSSLERYFRPVDPRSHVMDLESSSDGEYYI